MNYIDFTILIVIGIGFILGFKDGLVRKLIGLGGFIAAILLAFQLSSTIGKLLSPMLNDEEYLAEIIAGILIFFLVVLAASILKRVVHPADKINKITNQVLGGIAGVIQISFFVSAFLLLINIFSIPSTETKKNSFLYFAFRDLMPVTVDLLLGKSSDATDYLRNMLESYENVNPLERDNSLSSVLDHD